MNTAWILCLSALYLAALGGLLWVAHANRRLYAAAKGFCSALFVLCALLCWFGGAQRAPWQFALLLAGLLLCAFGDVLLGVANLNAARVSKKPFLAGAASFTLAHLLLCAHFYLRLPFAWYDLALPALLLAAMYLLEKRGAVRLKKIRPVAYLYTFLVGLMAAKALAAALLVSAPPAQRLVVAAGALLFLVSDAVLLFLYFGHQRRKWYRAANLLCYYGGVWLLALGAYWL